MLEIAICDDEMPMVQNLEEMVEGIPERHQETARVSVYVSAEKLLEQISHTDIVFLDIEMPGIDGIAAGKRIRENNRNCHIIMATGRTERFKEAFQIQASRFVTKPFTEAEVEEALMAAMQEHIGRYEIEAYSGRKKYVLEERQIVYVKAEYGCVRIHGQMMDFRKEIGLKELEAELDSRMFARIHRMYLVNLLYVDTYEDGEVVIGQERFVVSRRNQADFRRKYIEFDIKYRKMVAQ